VKTTSPAARVDETVLSNERRGDYLGKTVQVIPHITDEIKRRIRSFEQADNADILITEIGGTTGDIEGLPFLEAIRQFILQVGPENAILIHVTLVPFIKAAGELKTKPTQQSVAKLREIGLQPQILLCRTEHPIERDVREKLSLDCNVPVDAVIEARDVEHSIYEFPLMLQAEGLDEKVCRLLRLDLPAADMEGWRKMVHSVVHPSRRTTIAVVGKYVELQDAYKSIYEALRHAGAANDCAVDLKIVDAEEIETDGAAKHLAGVSASSSREDSATAEPRARSSPHAMPARPESPISASVWACRSRPLNSLATSAGWRAPTAPNSTPGAPIPSSRCSTSRWM